MKSNNNIFIRLLSLLLVLGMTVFSSSFATIVVAAAGDLGEGSVKKSKLEDVTGIYDSDHIRDKVFNDSVSKNPLDPEADYWMLVYFGGESISEKYTQSGSELSLTDYVKSDEATALKNEIEKKHNAFLADLDESGIPYKLKYSYSLLSNAVAIQVKYKYKDKISSISGVSSVSVSERYLEPKSVTVNDANVWGTGIYKTDGIDYDGNGLLVAVLDTGLDSSHPAFQTMPTVRPGVDYLTKDEVNKRVFNGTPGGLTDIDGKTTANDVYYNFKVPFAYDYADKDPVVYPSYSTHGVHVAGIIAGNLGADSDKYICDGDGNPILGDDGKPLTFRGVAPEAQLAICKVFTDRENSESLGGAETVDILAALEDCVKLGVDIINMSLGSSCGFSGKDDDHMEKVYSSIRAAGISLVVAASNDYSSATGSNSGTNLTSNPDSATVGAPSTFPEAMSVASISGQKSQYIIGNKGSSNESFIFFAEASDGNSNPKEFVKELLDAFGKSGDDELTLQYAVIGLYGRTAGYTGIDVSGKIALIQRGGEMTFEEKVSIAKMHGAIGCIIHNNVSGTIRMSIGNANAIPTCSITMDAAQSLLNNVDPVTKTGTVTISKTQVGGPFMSDFSSWGPTPSLQLKPEITAHGGEITSSVPGGWDEYSGTSMATPNMAGAMALVLQYLSDKFPDMNKNDRLTMANRLVMSATTIAYDEFGTPYSPRKQGAGLAVIKNAIETGTYLKVDGIDKTKLELGDDKTKTGVYVLNFDLVNFGDISKTYDLSTLTMTETVASDGRTVAEHAYMLDDMCDIVFTVDGKAASNKKVTVSAGSTAKISVKITLKDDARKYLDANFVNGMYVEGFVCLKDTAVSGSIDLSIPWLAFYGDWHAAPMFDLSEYEVSKAEQDDSIPDEEKPQEAVFATVPLGSYYNDKYIIPLGTYLYNIPDSMNKKMYADEDKIAISMYDEVNHRTVYKLNSIYAGLLRGAKTMDISIKDAVTGEVLYEENKVNIRKAYSGGSASPRASFIELELDPKSLGLANNRKYLFEMHGTMDGVLDSTLPESRPEDSFSFPFYVDNEAPEIKDYRVRFDPYKDGKETKYKVYLDVDVYDNHYAQSLALCYLNVDENELDLLSGDMIPIESGFGETTTVTVDITEYYYSDIDIYLQVDDYALNTRSYNLTEYKTLAESVNYPDSITFADGESVNIDINEAKLLDISVAPSGAADTNLYWTTSDKNVVRVENGTIFGVSKGTATITVYAGPNASSSVKATLKVNVSENVATNNIKLKSLKLDMIYNGDKELVNPTNAYVDMNPNTTFRLVVKADPWYFSDTLDIRFSSSAPDVASVNEKTGVVHTLQEGTAFITAKQYVDGRPTAFSVTAKLNVGPEFDVRNGILYGYYGLGGKVTIPKSLNVYYIYEEAFKDNNNITELEISSPCSEIQLAAFEHMTALERVIIPDSVSFVATGAFRNCPKLKQIDLRSRAVTFSTRCFEGCSSLKYINNMTVTDKSIDTKKTDMLSLNDTQFIRTSPHIGTLGTNAFKDCTSLETLDITLLRVCGEAVFENCSSLEKVIMSEHTVLGDEMFDGCSKLKELEFTDTGMYDFGSAVCPFSGCAISKLTFPNGVQTYYKDPDTGVYYTDSSRKTLVFAPQNLKSFTAPDSLETILENAFAGSTRLSTVNLGKVKNIGSYAFSGCISESFKRITIPSSVENMGVGVFYGSAFIETANVQAKINKLPAYTFALCGLKNINLNNSIVSLGDYSLYYTDFEDLDLTDTKIIELDNYVFANTWKLKTIKLPALTKIGYGTFHHSYDEVANTAYPLQSVSFAPGTTAIGTATFRGEGGFPALTSIVLPDSVRDSVSEVGEHTFSGCSAVQYLNLGSLTSVERSAFRGCSSLGKNGDPGFTTEKLKYIGDNAFNGCESIKVLDISKAEYIGNSAFKGTSLTSVDLSACTTLGASAFFGIPLSSVTGMTKLKTIGNYAFANTKLSGTFTLPGSISEKQGAIGSGLVYGTDVNKIGMPSGNKVYYVENDVLYSVLPNGGIQLEMVAPGYMSETFNVKPGVVRVGDDAFRGTTGIKNVIFSDTVKAIGDKAFYESQAKSYTFEGLEAPILEAYLVKDTDFTVDWQQKIFEYRIGKGEEKYYANFVDYVAFVLYPELSSISDLGLTLTYPKNAAGFDNRTWKVYFSTVNTSPTKVEPTTQTAIDSIASIPTVDEIKAITSISSAAEQSRLLTEYRDLVSKARLDYNRVTNTEQMSFIKDAEKLFSAEAAIREVRKALGETVKINELRVKVYPSKTVYVDGEYFDATGMVLVLIYDDGSEEQVTSGYTLPTEALKAGQQTVTFSYAGISKTISVTVNRGTNTDTPGGDETTGPVDSSTEEPGTEKTNDNDGNPVKVTVIVLVIVIIAMIAGGGCAAIIILQKRRKTSSKNDAENGDGNGDANNDSEDDTDSENDSENKK